MMKLNYSVYKDKVNACWLGKNIGGTMGGPYEGTHDYLDVQGFVTKKGEVLPNDDLDLQLVWLMALERTGPSKINASLLAEYWISFITPHWAEYGICKANMKKGLLPPLAGDYGNSWKNSNGAWIRTEIWASIVPGNPGAAALYAMEDAKVDHGAGEGTYAAAFVAAMQSAAFVVSDIRKCIDVGLAVIPASSRVASSVKFVIESYDNGVSPRETRDKVIELNKDIGDGWFEAPSNIAFAVLGMLYGEGDFKKSMIAAINCGDDTDCTAATVGATLGILYGMEGLPRDWCEHLGDEIVTISIAKGTSVRIPKTITALTERVVKVAPAALYVNNDVNFDKNTDITITEGESEIPENIDEILMKLVYKVKGAVSALKPYTLRFEAPTYNANIVLDRAPDIAPGEEISVTVRCVNKNHFHDDAPYTLSLRWLLPDGFSVSAGKSSLMIYNWTNHTPSPFTETTFVLKAGERVEPINRAVLEIVCDGRPNILYCPITLLG